MLRPDGIKTQDELVNPYADFLSEIEKPSRYIGNEKFIIRKQWENCSGQVALCFPDTYELGMGHLGLKILYKQLNQYDDIVAERVFAPWIDMEKMLREKSLPLVSLETYKPLYQFQIVGFSLQYELSYTNILTMLDLGGISLWQKDRKEYEPFVIAGGPCATHPEPIAPFMDFIVIGDGEDLFVRLTKYISKARSEGAKRKKILLELASWAGIYVPSLYNTEIEPLNDLEVVTTPKVEGIPKRIKRFIVDNLNNYPFPTEVPIAHANAIFDNYSVELARGCTEGCRFCQAGMIYRPVREREPNNVIETVMEGMKKGGLNQASLTCLSTADYSAVTPLILDLLDKIKEQKGTLGIASLRAYGLDPRVIDKMAEVQNTSLTFAPEAGSERMRKVINKNITEKDMLQTAEDVFSRGLSKMKLYFMIGLPTETDEDVGGIMETGRSAKLIGDRLLGRGRAKVTVSVSTFVPKPHTPFQWAAMNELSEIERKQKLLFILSKNYNVQFRRHFSKSSYMEGIVARGDRRIGQVIYDVWKEGGRFDGWDEGFKFDQWMNALEKNNLKVETFLRTLRLDSRLPWDHIDVGLEDKFLEREWKKSLKDRISPPCGKPAGAIVHHTNIEALNETHEVKKKKLVCYHCGVKCDLDGMIKERKDFLTSLNAFEDSPYERPDNLKKDLLDYREKRGQNIGHKYRIRFSKIGPISFISHLDLQKIMARILRRAEIDTLYSEGYKQRALISFGPAISLGISALNEWMDVRVPESWEDTEQILDLLNTNSEKGLIFHEIKGITQQDKSIQEAMESYYLYFPFKSNQNYTDKINTILESDELFVKKFNKKKKEFKNVNVRQKILSVEVGPSKQYLPVQYLKSIHEVSRCMNMDGIRIKCSAPQGQGVRAMDLHQALSDQGLELERPIKLGVNLVD